MKSATNDIICETNSDACDFADQLNCHERCAWIARYCRIEGFVAVWHLTNVYFLGELEQNEMTARVKRAKSWPPDRDRRPKIWTPELWINNNCDLWQHSADISDLKISTNAVRIPWTSWQRLKCRFRFWALVAHSLDYLIPHLPEATKARAQTERNCGDWRIRAEKKNIEFRFACLVSGCYLFLCTARQLH